MSNPSFTYTSWALCPESSNLEINQEKLFFTLDDIDIPVLTPPDQDQSDKDHGIEQITHDFIDLESSGMVRKCCQCLAEKTPQWREGPLGPKTLCNACWTRFKSCSQYCEADKTPKWRESDEIKPMPFQPCDDRVGGENHGTVEQITNFIDSSGADKKQRTKRRMKQENQNVLNCFQNNMAWKCCHCLAEKTPQWQEGPLGPKTLCNACGERFKSGRLAQQSRPAESTTFDVEKHSNFHRKKMKIEPA